MSQLSIIMADALSQKVDYAVSVGFIAATGAVRGLRWHAAAHVLIQTGDVLLRNGLPADAAKCYSTVLWMFDQRYFSRGVDPEAIPMYGAWRPFAYLLAKAIAGEAAADIALGATTSEAEVFGRLSFAEMYLEHSERPLELARLHLTIADHEVIADRQDRALQAYLKAFDRIDRARYDLRDPVTRLAWLRTNLAAHRGALKTAHAARDDATVCELIEVARLQALPAATANGIDPSDVEVPLQTPPRIAVGGRASLINATGVPPDTRVIDLRVLLGQTRGNDAWLLSYWSNEDGCYWSVLSSRAVYSGRLDLDDSQLAATMAELEDALPNPKPGEDNDDRVRRVVRGPYYTDREAERVLATHLRILLPDPLVDQLRNRTAEDRLPLTICPSPDLARVPWPLIAVDDDGEPASGGPTRLLEVADVQLGLTTALTSHLLGTERADYLRHVEVIVDPSGERPDGEGELRQARRAVEKLSGTTPINGGRWQRGDDPVTLAKLAEVLKAVDPGAALLFIGHAISPEPGRSSVEASLALAAPVPGGIPERLSAATLLRPASRELAMRFPSRVVLAACNTASVDQSEAGDWLSLVPAIHWSGAAEVVSSTVPVPDGSLRLEIGLAEWMADARHSDTSLAFMLLSLQRDALRRWIGGEQLRPLAWAFYLHSGVTPQAQRLIEDDRPDPRVVWTAGAVELFRGAAEFAAAFRRRTMHPSCITLTYIGEDVFEIETMAGGLLLVPGIGWELINPLHNPIPRLRKRSAKPSRSCLQLVTAAEEHARARRSRYVLAGDVLLALVAKRRTSGAFLARVATRIRHAAVRTEMLTESPMSQRAPRPDYLSYRSKAEAGTLIQLGFTEQWFRRNAAFAANPYERGVAIGQRRPQDS